ncbi:hypothetical protein DVA81_19370, partial [Acinetobacter baumannii]
MPLRNSNPLRQILWAYWLIQFDAPNYCKEVFQSNLQTSSEGWHNEGDVEKFQLIFSHPMKTITPLASFL